MRDTWAAVFFLFFVPYLALSVTSGLQPPDVGRHFFLFFFLAQHFVQIRVCSVHRWVATSSSFSSQLSTSYKFESATIRGGSPLLPLLLPRPALGTNLSLQKSDLAGPPVPPLLLLLLPTGAAAPTCKIVGGSHRHRHEHQISSSSSYYLHSIS